MFYPSISLVIPCYNEAERINLLCNGIASFANAWKGPFDIVIIDDGSTDTTSVLLSNHPMVVSLKDKIQLIHQENTGKGGALKQGVANTKGDFVLTLDADMATQPSELIQWLQIRKEFYPKEILIGSRELKQSHVHDLGHRKVIGNIFNFVIRSLVGLQINDTQCGFKLYPSSIAKELFSNLQTLGWAHDVELLKKANQAGYAIIEMPIHWTAIEGSKINVLKDSWNMFWEVVKIRGIK